MPYDRAAAVAEGDFFFAFPGDEREAGVWECNVQLFFL
jgi:hypothetical protein